MKQYCATLAKGILLFTGCASLFSCALPSTANTPSPSPIDDCVLISPPAPGWSWEGLTIGVSTTIDITREFGAPDNEVSWAPCLRLYVYKESEIAFETYNGILNQILIRLYKHNPETGKQDSHIFDGIPRTLRDARILYGDPDIVTFGFDAPSNRYVIWSKQGVVASMFLENHQSLEQAKIYEISYLSTRAMTVFLAFERDLGKTPPSNLVRNLLPEDRNPYDQWERWLPEGN